MAALNVLHGVTACGGEATANCRAEDRLSLLADAIEAAGCPDVVGLQEVAPELQGARLPEMAADGLCAGAYDVAYDPQNPVDTELTLSAVPIVDQRGIQLSGPPWSAQWTRLDTDIGPVDLVVTHFASSSFNPPCDPSVCAPYCETGVELGTCNAREVLDFLDRRGDPNATWIVAGDLNGAVDDPRVGVLTEAGFRDSWTEGGNPECDPATGEGCTCCIGGPGPLEGLDRADRPYDTRIDFVLVRPGPDCDLAFVDPTGGFADQPAAEPANGVVWVSDHGGVQATLTC